MKKQAFAFLFCSLFLFTTHAKVGSGKPPRLILTVVIDQFRADQLSRWQDRFAKGGFQRLINQGAVIPFAEYPVLQNMTCPGHAMILTGTIPARNGIALNEWWDSKQKKKIYCVEDEEFGLSPRRLQGSTLGDQIKMRWPESKVIGVSLKDRASILMTGRSADAAYWFDSKTLNWTTSGYYKNALEKLKNWKAPQSLAKDEVFTWKNTRGRRPFEKKLNWGSVESFASPRSLDETLAFAKTALKEHKLGQGSTPDLLAVSFSTHDVAGHQFGPDSPEIEDITLIEDRIVEQLFNEVQKHVPGGMANVWVLFTADHGVAPTVESATNLGLDAGRISTPDLVQNLNESLKEKFGSCRSGDWISGARSFHFYFEPTCLEQAGQKRSEIESLARSVLSQSKGVETVVLRSDVEAGRWPQPPFDEQLKKSFIPGISGDLILIPKAFYFEQSRVLTTHMTSYSYDRQVPLILMGRPFKAGVSNTPAQVIDAAPTLAHALRVLAPAASSGRVLSEILLPEKL